LSNELERQQGKPADCDPLLKTDYDQKNLKRENIIKQYHRKEQVFLVHHCTLRPATDAKQKMFLFQ